MKKKTKFVYKNIDWNNLQLQHQFSTYKSFVQIQYVDLGIVLQLY